MLCASCAHQLFAHCSWRSWWGTGIIFPGLSGCEMVESKLNWVSNSGACMFAHIIHPASPLWPCLCFFFQAGREVLWFISMQFPRCTLDKVHSFVGICFLSIILTTFSHSKECRLDLELGSLGVYVAYIIRYVEG